MFVQFLQDFPGSIRGSIIHDNDLLHHFHPLDPPQDFPDGMILIISWDNDCYFHGMIISEPGMGTCVYQPEYNLFKYG